eukprot:163529-Pelagomonas_calceolata.AAC.1
MLRQQALGGSRGLACKSSTALPRTSAATLGRPRRAAVQPIVASDSFKNFFDKLKGGGKGGAGGEDAARKAIQVSALSLQRRQRPVTVLAVTHTDSWSAQDINCNMHCRDAQHD